MAQGQRETGSPVVAGTAVIAVTYGLIRFGYGLHLPAFTAEFGLSAGQAGGIAAGSFAAYCASALLAQWSIALGRPRSALWTAGALATVGALGTAAAWSAVSLAVAVLVAGSAAGAASPALVVAVAASVSGPAADRSQAVVNSGTGVGVVAGGLLAAALAGQWRLLWVGFALAAVSVTWWADRRTTWPTSPATARATGRLRHDTARLRPVLLAAVLAGAGSAAVWTFGRDVLGAAGVPEQTSGLLWSVLGGAGVVGALSGDLVRRLGPATTWAAAAVVMAGATAVLVVVPGRVLPAAVALAGFGGSYVVLSGVLIAWASGITPHRAAESTAALFVALTAGQAAGAAALGALAGATSSTAMLLAAAALIVLSIVPTRRRDRTRSAGLSDGAALLTDPAGPAPARAHRVPSRRQGPRSGGAGSSARADERRPRR